MKKIQSNTKTGRLFRAITLHGFWKLRWYQTVFILWPMLIVAAWGASPYFMVYVVGMPAPGTAPRYVGTIRFEGELQRTKTGWIPPRYFIQTSNGEVEFHCRYRPAKGECSFTTVLGAKPKTDDVYEIGYDSYWGLDYIKYPDHLSKLNDYGEAKNITNSRVALLYKHERSVMWLCFLFATYLYLIWLAYQKSDPDSVSSIPASNSFTDAPAVKLPFVKKDTSDKPSQPKPRRSFFD
jgi:hypothetical protein